MKIIYYETSLGRSTVSEFIDCLPDDVVSDFALAVDRLKSGETLEMPISKPLFNIARSLYELRLKGRDGIYRVFYFIKKKEVIYLVHAIKKKTQRLQEKDKKLILKRLREIRD